MQLTFKNLDTYKTFYIPLKKYIFSTLYFHVLYYIFNIQMSYFIQILAVTRPALSVSIFEFSVPLLSFCSVQWTQKKDEKLVVHQRQTMCHLRIQGKSIDKILNLNLLCLIVVRVAMSAYYIFIYPFTFLNLNKRIHIRSIFLYFVYIYLYRYQQN